MFLPWWLISKELVKNPPTNVGNAGSIPELRISPGEGNGNPFQYSGLENSMDRGAWWAVVHGLTELHTEHVYVLVCAHTHTCTQAISSVQLLSCSDSL